MENICIKTNKQFKKEYKDQLELYPLKFEPILKQKVWGGSKLVDFLGKDSNGLTNIGESWELSALPNNLSVVSEGDLKGFNIEQLITKYKAGIVGEKVYNVYGKQFPLLIKFIDANEYLSVQVHPDDEMAKIEHNSKGKTEMWYVVDADEDAELIVGFNKKVSKQDYLNHFSKGNLLEILNREKVVRDDVFFIPAGRIHAAGPGVLFAEIQQTSDITYRVYDWDRVGIDGVQRELHTEQALEAIDFDFVEEYKTGYLKQQNISNRVVKSNFFTTNILTVRNGISFDYAHIDSFVVYMGIEGLSSVRFSQNEAPILLGKGETLLIPACINKIKISPISKGSKILEIYI